MRERTRESDSAEVTSKTRNELTANRDQHTATTGSFFDERLSQDAYQTLNIPSMNQAFQRQRCIRDVITNDMGYLRWHTLQSARAWNAAERKVLKIATFERRQVSI